MLVSRVSGQPDPTNLVAHWDFDQGSGTVLTDVSGNGRTGTFSSTPSWAAGQINGALSFNGTDSVNIGNITSINNAGKVTLAGWMKRGAANARVLLGKQTTNQDLAIEFWDDGRLYFQMSKGSDTYGYITLNDTAWHHIALVFDGSQTGNANRLKAYVDGTLRTLTFNGTVPSSTTTNTTPFRIGRVDSYYSNGLIDDVWLYTRSLSQAEVQDLGTVSVDTTAPSVPANLSATAVSQTQVNLSWNAATDNVGVMGYRIYRNGALHTTVTTTSFQDTGLSPNTSYAYTVAAYDLMSNESAQSVAASATTFAPPPVPTVDLSVADDAVATGGSTMLTWSSTDATSCTASGGWSGGKTESGSQTIQNIQTATDYNLNCTGPGGQASDSVTVNILPQCSDGLDNDTDGFLDANDPGCSSPEDDDEFNPDSTSPTVPGLLQATADSAYEITLGWDASTDNIAVTGYRIYRDGVQIDEVTELIYQNIGLTPETTYLYAVSAIDAAGNESAQSVAEATTLPLPPLPVVTLTAEPMIVEAGQGTSLSWSTSDATTCTASGGWSGNKTTAGAETISNLFTAQTLTLVCTGIGGEAQDEVTVSVIDTTAPTIPANLTATPISMSQINLDWDASSDTVSVTGYRIYRDGAEISTTTGTSFEDTGLTADTTYAYAVIAYDAAENQSIQATVGATTFAPAPAPTLSVTAEPTTVEVGGSIVLNWSSTDATSCTASGGWSGSRATSGTQIISDLQVTTTFTLDCDGTGGSVSDQVEITVNPFVDTLAPTTPQNISATVVSQSAVQLSWNASFDFIGVTGYRIYRDGAELTTTAAAGLTYQDTGLTAGTSYTYTVTAYDAAGNESTQSNTAEATTLAPVPTVSLVATPAAVEADGSATLSWTSVDAASCEASDGWTGTKPSNGNEVISHLLTGRTFVLTCTSTGGQASSQTSITVVDTTAPTVPTNLSASSTSHTTVQLSWTTSADVIGVAGYRVFRNGTPLPVVTSTAFEDTSLMPETQYSYAVSAIDAAGNESAQSAIVNVTTQAAPVVPAGLTVSADNRHILDEQGNPIFINGDTAWSMFAELNESETITYLNDRQSKGFNTLIVNMIEYAFASDAPRNAYGQGPFTTPNDFSTPNEAYFAHVDWAIQQATDRGFYLFIVPSYIGYGGPGTDQGWYDEMAQNGTTKLRNYGRYIGNRYKSYDNIVWMNGGDANPPNKALVDEIAQGIRELDTNNLHTAHTAPDNNASDYWGTSSWLNIDNVYNYSDLYSNAQDLYQANARPFFTLETNYENEHNTSQSQLRAQAYAPVLAGAQGNMFGNCPIWHFGSSNSWCGITDWQGNLDSQGAQSMQHFGNLFNSRDWANLVPDFNHTVMTGGVTSGGFNYSAAARTANGDTVIAYIPTRRNVTIDMTKVSGGLARAWWYNPANGQATNLGTFATTGSRTFTPPTTNTDWVLVLDNASLTLPAPGGAVVDVTAPVVSITSPAQQATVQGTISLAAAATDNVSVADVTFFVDNVQVGSPVSTNPYQAQFDTTTLANGPKTIKAVARDSSNNTAEAQITIEVDNPEPEPDTTSPTVNITAPSNGTTVGGTVAISAAASDNVAVAEVTFYVGGTAIGSEGTSSAYGISWNTASLANGSYQLTAVARDTSNNTATSSVVTVTVNNTAPSSLLVALGFNNAANPRADASSRANHATCGTSCPAYSANGGYQGSGAYNFAGANNWLALPNESQFDFTNNFTVSFWMKASGFSNPWEAFVAKGDSAWEVTRFNNTSNAVFTTFSPGPHDMRGTKVINDGNWHHIAIVYNGSTKYLYVDGQLDASAAFTAAVRTNNLQVRLGYNQEYTQADYTGWLDDVRIYNVARSQAEIQTDMTTPVN